MSLSPVRYPLHRDCCLQGLQGRQPARVRGLRQPVSGRAIAFSSRNAGFDTIVATVKLFGPDVRESTHGGMELIDQLGSPVAVIGVDMLLGTTLTDASGNVANIARARRLQRHQDASPSSLWADRLHLQRFDDRHRSNDAGQSFSGLGRLRVLQQRIQRHHVGRVPLRRLHRSLGTAG